MSDGPMPPASNTSDRMRSLSILVCGMAVPLKMNTILIYRNILYVGINYVHIPIAHTNNSHP